MTIKSTAIALSILATVSTANIAQASSEKSSAFSWDVVDIFTPAASSAGIVDRIINKLSFGSSKACGWGQVVGH